MPNKTKRGPSNTAYFKNYEAQNRKEKNKEKRIEKHLNKHSNDVQSLERKPVDYTPKKKKPTDQ